MLALVVAVIWVAVLARGLEKKKPSRWKERRDGILTVTGIILILGGAYISYGSFRNQTRLSAETSLNQEAQSLMGYEMSIENKDVRCIYYNYGWDDYSECRKIYTSSREKWSSALFYAEEVIFVLTKANSDRDHWGSRYAYDVGYWQEDVSRDPTGLFSYYLVATSDNLSEAKKSMIDAGICIRNMCEGFNAVERSLGENAPRWPRRICKTKAEQLQVSEHCQITPPMPSRRSVVPAKLNSTG